MNVAEATRGRGEEREGNAQEDGIKQRRKSQSLEYTRGYTQHTRKETETEKRVSKRGGLLAAASFILPSSRPPNIPLPYALTHEPCPQRGPVIMPQTPSSSAEDCRESFVTREARPSRATIIASSLEQYPDVTGIES
ncbi:unnamed protein product [Pleuronectes platessa]|uniref:Uncharacterized protein n=1 Tax=Pleuronectes platessa TaxID=8262 RepID=A0A9N7UV85_PLEPL|nr:unnamed protein product [Pleuronectes platessa]